MADKHFKCTQCGHSNTVTEPDYSDILEKAGGRALLTLLATAATLPFGGVGGLAAGIYFSSEGVYNYASIECENCSRRFMIARWTKGDD